MIVKSNILRNLRQLDKLYNAERSPKKAQFYSKLAILELCGWTEEAMDIIIFDCCSKFISDPLNIRYVNDNIIKKTWGFEYNTYFRDRMVMKMVGIIYLEKIESRVNLSKFIKLKAALSKLHLERNAQAHTYLKGTTPTISAPSLTMSTFMDVYEGLKDYSKCIMRIKVK